MSRRGFLWALLAAMAAEPPCVVRPTHPPEPEPGPTHPPEPELGPDDVRKLRDAGAKRARRKRARQAARGVSA